METPLGEVGVSSISKVAVVGRLAPSPTGGLHLGHARTFLVAWLAARSAGGRVILRIEDLDPTRNCPDAVRGIIDDLQWLGLDWDEGPDIGGPSGPYLQSQRLAHYEEAWRRLSATESIYPCTCSRSEIARSALAPHVEDEGPTYSGTCSWRSVADARSLGDTPIAWRFRVPAGPVEWDDLVRGRCCVDPRVHGGDFLVARGSRAPSYQLAVVVDDAAMGVTQVIRGDDLLSSTPRQALLYRQWGWPVPEFGHVPLAMTPDGRRLAKRAGSIKLATLRERGANPRRLVGWIARSCKWIPTWEPVHPRAGVGCWDPLTLPSEPWVVSPQDIESLVTSKPLPR
jgi:glutamyl-tRNA synthetase